MGAARSRAREVLAVAIWYNNLGIFRRLTYNFFYYCEDPFAEADDDTGESKQQANYIHIRIQHWNSPEATHTQQLPDIDDAAERNGRKTLTTVQGLPKKFDQKKILKVIKKKFACNGTIVNDTEMGEVIQLQGDQRKDVQEFLVDKKEGLELDAKTIKVRPFFLPLHSRWRDEGAVFADIASSLLQVHGF
ncbi:hypothetical protein MBLNU230_g3156t1 [Neophaeotheca triangularis]